MKPNLLSLGILLSVCFPAHAQELPYQPTGNCLNVAELQRQAGLIANARLITTDVQVESGSLPATNAFWRSVFRNTNTRPADRYFSPLSNFVRMPISQVGCETLTGMRIIESSLTRILAESDAQIVTMGQTIEIPQQKRMQIEFELLSPGRLQMIWRMPYTTPQTCAGNYVQEDHRVAFTSIIDFTGHPQATEAVSADFLIRLQQPTREAAPGEATENEAFCQAYVATQNSTR